MNVLFGSPALHALVLGVGIVSALLGVTSYFIWFERKFAGRMQSRIGPKHVGPYGLLQPIADAFKLLIKADITPDTADRALFNLAPLLAVCVALLSLAVLPLASGLVIADLDVGVLFFLAAGALTVVPTWMAGWGSNNKYALLGGMRAIAQSVAYGVPLVLAALVPVILSGSMKLSDIVAAQAGGHWFALWPPGPGLGAGVLFVLASLAEGNRIPFDIPEAESELVSGISTEYTGMKFGMFYLGEYVHSLVVAALFVTLFLGGYDGPGPDVLALQLLWFVLKVSLVSVLLLWVRWSYVRLRSDQLMTLCWKYLLPSGLLLVAASAVWVWWTEQGGSR
ncbi:MAG: NADH-quinone oxidoreductase subunit NuoH [Planctomycetes bacterium]|nr:NADH-quinone oxidoreductase subunit NuoH [Planctomycetota bacterium]